MDRGITLAHLSIFDGVWQESPDNIAVAEESARGTLCLVAEITGDPAGRGALARELVEAAKCEYLTNRGSIALALTLAMRAANSVFYNYNLSTPREARRIAGLTAVALRENELFIAQGGPGLTCLVREGHLFRYPDSSPWYDPTDSIGEFTSSGTVPLGLRREYTPDVFHITLQSGDSVLLATRQLAHLLNDDELLDTVMRRHPDEVMENLEDIAGSTDLSVIAFTFGDLSSMLAPPPTSRPEAYSGESESQENRDEQASGEIPEQVWEETEETEPEPGLVSEPETADNPVEFADVEPVSPAGRPRIHPSNILSPVARLGDSVGESLDEVDWHAVDSAVTRLFGFVVRGLATVTTVALRAFVPGDVKALEPTQPSHLIPNLRSAMKFAALAFPILLVLAGAVAWLIYRADVQRTQSRQAVLYVDQANALIESGKTLARTDKSAARDALQKALTLAQQAQRLSPSNADARTATFLAQDWLDTVNGVSVVFFLPRFAAFSDTGANPARVVSRVPDIFVLDRGLQRIYRYTMNDSGSAAAPFGGDGIILKTGDRVGDRPVGEIVDILWNDSGRLVALERSGQFLQYDPVKSGWTARSAGDSQWARVSIASSYLGNLYLLDSSKNQIWKYVATNEGAWSAAISYFAPGVTVDLSNVIDFAIDGDLWLLRGDGSVWRLSGGRLADYSVKDLDIPLSKPVALYTSPNLVGLYVADAGNQRIVQFDKVTGKYVRQFKPKGETRDAFNSLKAFTADEISKKFFFVNGNQAYLATIPQ